jgi:3-methyladenine DNA glycosylase AlkD
MMAQLAVHDKNAEDRCFERFLSVIKREAVDERNFVKKAVSWALRQVGKRNPFLHNLALQTAGEIGEIQSGAAKWVASDALRDLTREKIQRRMQKDAGAEGDNP